MRLEAALRPPISPKKGRQMPGFDPKNSLAARQGAA
jgi:hypothetical protein